MLAEMGCWPMGRRPRGCGARTCAVGEALEDASGEEKTLEGEA